MDQSFPPPSWQEQLEELAYVLDKEEAGKQLINNYWQRIEKLKKVLGDRHQNSICGIFVKIAWSLSASDRSYFEMGDRIGEVMGVRSCGAVG